MFRPLSLAPVIARSEATKQSMLPFRGDVDCFASLAMTEHARLRMMSSAVTAVCPLLSPTDQLFIGQIASETAACSGKIVTKFFAEYCNSTGSAKLFCPISSNLTRRHGMMV